MLPNIMNTRDVVYFESDVKKLRRAILIGSLIPLVCYIFWDMVIMGVLPLEGLHGLIAIMQSKNSTSDLVNSLNSVAANDFITFAVKLFTSICVLTSFLGVSLCLMDFMADGLQVEKKGFNKIIVSLITFVPPVVIVMFWPNMFIKALEYAGIYCVVLLVLMPAWMVWCGRYRRVIAKGYRMWGGKTLLIALILFSLVMIAHGLVG